MSDPDNKDVKTPEVQPRPVPSQHITDELVLAQYEEANKAGFPTDKVLSVMSKFADYCVTTQQMPKTVDTTAKAIMVFQMGRELGIPPMQSLYSFYFVNNKLTMYGAKVIERIRRWATIEYGECNDKEANITITRKDDGTKLSTKVTMEELQARGATGGKDTFKKHPKTMLIYKAVGEIVRHIVPEAVGASAVEGDYGDDSEMEKEMQLNNFNNRLREVTGTPLNMGKFKKNNDKKEDQEIEKIDDSDSEKDEPTIKRD